MVIPIQIDNLQPDFNVLCLVGIVVGINAIKITKRVTLDNATLWICLVVPRGIEPLFTA